MMRFFFLLCCGLAMTAACTRPALCALPEGHWSDREGQDFVFLPNSDRILWLVRFGSTFDTMRLRGTLDCKASPAAFTMTAFENGPYVGKTLYAILEWTSDTTFRVRYEPGSSEAVRPRDFNADETLKFFPVKK